MAVKVVTDSTSDIPLELARELDITIVPVYVRFNSTVYRDRVDISPREFFDMLATSQHHPASTQPTPEDFTEYYKDLCECADGIISIHISSKISGTFNAARIASHNLMSQCPIEIMDSGMSSAGLALVVMAAARTAVEGQDMSAVLAEARKAISQTSVIGMFETTKYLSMSGRVNKNIATATRALSVVPLLTFRDGEIARLGMARNISRGLEKVFDYIDSKRELLEIIIVHSNAAERALQLRKRLGWIFPEDSIRIFEMGAALGTHAGPGVIIVGVREDG